MNEFASYNENNIPKDLLSYDGKTGKIFGIWIKNFFLSLITLGIYRAWAKTNMRKYTFSSFQIDGSRLEYSGKGGELFKGFVVVALFYFFMAIVVDFAIEIFYPEEYEEMVKVEQGEPISYDNQITQEEIEARMFSQELASVWDYQGNFDVSLCLDTYGAVKCEELYGEHLAYEAAIAHDFQGGDIPDAVSEVTKGAAILMGGKTAFFMLIGTLFLFFATFSAFRYRLTRTRYKGIHGAVRGVTARGYVWLRVRRMLLNIITLGLAIGRSDLIAQKYILQNSYIGKTKFTFEPNVKALDKVNFVTLLLAIPTVFISRFWYKAALLNEKYNSLSLGNIKMEAKFTGGKLFWLRFSNTLLFIISLGLLSAYILNRSLRFLESHVSIRGNENDLKLVQEQAESNTIGEGLDDAADFGGFDVDFGMI